MKRYRWQITLGAALLMTSIFCYAIQLAIFHDRRDTFFYMLQDIAFVPIQVLLVTLVINELLQKRDKIVLQHKMNMLIGAFFSEAGTQMLRRFSQFDTAPGEVRKLTHIQADWTGRQFVAARRRVMKIEYNLDCHCADMAALKTLMVGHRSFLMELIGNPNLLEHETFTELLWALSHLTEELVYRPDPNNLPESDYNHLAGDMKRAYVLLISEWLGYVRHLREDYPFMFSLVLRVNPFEPETSAVVTE